MRTATRDFRFAGHLIPEGETVFIGTSVPHFLDEYYPDAKKFDIDRFEKPRAEHMQAGAYSPYGRGQHVCLGKALADIQMLVTMARMFHKLDLSLTRRTTPWSARPPRYRDRRCRSASGSTHIATKLGWRAALPPSPGPRLLAAGESGRSPVPAGPPTSPP